ncbi:PAP/OAS1 substrate-binding domain superfamily [Zea mays]|uniref:PAP/OAS1 substrate-binding domain superfamily n=1 Tax=Zea mays TaxID=4577 RepID=A0A1D6QGJ2_MAIZE|nr:PAP/OAS1 substrate-binding domain superfamily [Zea mays]
MVDISECSPVPESVPAHPDPASVSPDAWRRFETAALAVVNKIQPTAASEHLRAAVVDYVKLVKCLVQNIVVDISVNQIGGLCTLCFLEKVDQHFGKDHLFKKSIILIKDWCYYESRILGAHHGLISTYALETLVLYIFHIFHKSLDGPLAVLYRFLDYYSKFDWDNKGISLFGPVSLSSLPELVTDPPDIQDDDFLQREEFLKECIESFSVLPRNSETNPRLFSRRFLNIVDPLKQSNNLGRSVSKGNFYRIRSAFDFGARKLGKILQVPSCLTVGEVNQFFRNTLKRNRTGLRPDVLVVSSDLVTNDPVSSDLDVERVNNVAPNNSCDVLSNQLSNINISDSNNHGSIKQKECNSMADHKETKSVSLGLLDSDATNHATTDSLSIRGGGNFSEASPVPSETSTLQSETGKKVDVRNDTTPSYYGVSAKQFTGRSHHYIEDTKHNAYPYSTGLVDGLGTSNSVLTSDTQPGGNNNDTVPNLTGDFDTNLHNLLYARGFHQDNPMTQLYYPMPMPPPLQYQNMHPSNGHGRKNPYGYAGRNGVVPGHVYPPSYFVYRPLYQADDHMTLRTRGTGTYFPDPNLRKDRPPTGRGERGRNHSHQNNYHKFHHHTRPDMPVDMIPLEELRHELPLQTYAPNANGHGIPSPMNIPISSPSSQSPRDPLNVPMHSPSSHVRKDNFHGNGFMLPQDSKLEFGTLGALPSEVASKDHANRSGSVSNNQASGPVSPMSVAKNTGMGSNGMRNVQPYRLKDSGDFPPLSS